MTFEEVLQAIYVGKLSTTNNYIYMSLKKEELEILKEMIKKNPFFEPINSNYFLKSGDEDFTYNNVDIDFSSVNIKNMLTIILKNLGLNYDLNFGSFKDAMLFSEILKKYKKKVNLHLFNIRLLNEKEQQLINTLLFETMYAFAIQTYINELGEIKTNKTDNGKEVIPNLHYRVVDVEPNYDLVKKYKSEQNK